MNANSHTIIPDHENHCVWMDAGLVNYKLCTCQFECETCPFDAVMRDQHQTFAQRAARHSGRLFPEPPSAAPAHFPAPEIPAASSAAEERTHQEEAMHRLLAPLRSVPLPQDRIYFSNHTWLRSHHDGTFTMGIDAFLAQLVAPVTSIAAIHAPAHIGRGEPYAWLMRSSGTFAVRNTEKGTVSAINPRLVDHPSLVTTDPYGDGWLTSIVCSQVSSSDLQYYTAEEFRTVIEKDAASVAAELAKVRRAPVGETMFDGGHRVDTIEKLIGEKRYTKLLIRLFALH